MSWTKRLLRVLFPHKLDSYPQERSAQAATNHVRTDLNQLRQAIGYPIHTPDLFVQALLHRSYHQRSSEVSLSNERLEFLGDSVLNLVVAEYLYRTFPVAHEGELTKIRSRLVNRKALAAYAEALHLSDHILMSQSAAHTVGKGIETIMADTFEAVIAAIYLDGGYKAARRFVEQQVIGAMKSGRVGTSDDNYKSMLLEYVQAKGLGIPRYTIVKEEGPDHDRTFTVDVVINNERKGSGRGKNKKEAEQAAAGQALQSLL